MAQAIYVRDAERMIISARLTTKGVFVRFADEREGLIPLGELKFASKPQKIQLSSPYVLEVLLRDGSREELPWDYVRAFVDPEYRARAEEEGRRGRRLLGERLKRLRNQKGLSQEELAARSQVSRVTIARLEAGEQDPQYETLQALSRGLGVPLERLLVD